ncbi:MAG: hypothetical protein SPI37_01440 [Eubacteriales bacterium]|nr:hypothetical protein [Eubacteriales bacterium]
MGKGKLFCEYDDLKSFVADYSKQYFKDICSSTPGVSKKNQTERSVECRIMKILHAGLRSADDVFDALAWKTGRIKQKRYSDDMPLEYYNGCDKEKRILKVWGRYIYLSDYAERIIRIAPAIESIAAEEDYASVFSQLLYDAPDGIGSVYAITLLFFITKGKQPIYDQYAMKALLDITPDKTLKYHELPQREGKGSIKKSLIEKLSNDYAKYKKLLQNHFGDKFKDSRDIDRALWVYGHLCKDKEKND